MQATQVVEHDETSYGRVLLRIRCQLPLGYNLQIWVHYEPAFQRYAYQLFTDRPILRWDNAPYHPEIQGFPHHFHDEVGHRLPSTLTGDPLIDVPAILNEIAQFLERETSNE
ncbi:MAG: DUF6516 family protein [Anaerolineae bacterium]